VDGTMRKAESEHVHCVLDPGCASRRLFEAVSGKWSPLVVMALEDGGKKRHGELRRELRGVSQKMLIQTLRQLETNGLVEREVYPVVPPKVEYSLTPLGRSLQPLLEAICQRSERRLPEVEEARLRAGADPFECGP
jgi:DNA-binding HxlR family transcriptional regulator